MHVTFPAKLPALHAVVLKIEGLKIVGFKPDRSVQFKDGKAVLNAAKAALHGPGIATERQNVRVATML